MRRKAGIAIEVGDDKRVYLRGRQARERNGCTRKRPLTAIPKRQPYQKCCRCALTLGARRHTPVAVGVAMLAFG